MNNNMIPLIEIEIVLNNTNYASKGTAISLVKQYLQNNPCCPNTIIEGFDPVQYSILSKEIKCIIIGDAKFDARLNGINLDDFEVKWYVYTLDQFGTMQQSECNGDDEEELVVASHLALPAAELYNAWENLYYDSDIKQNLLQYARTMMEFTDKGVRTNIVNCNRVILLHGPPGTGKTSLCQALAHKLTIRMHDRFQSGLFIEINSHSLLSKYFSESGKLVAKVFKKIKEIVENSSILVCVLIDEVESLARARNQCLAGTEPTDSIRVVNAVLTQIDQIKRHTNVLILTTSNMTGAIDLAFIDRADIKQFLGLPSPAAIYKIYYSCLQELLKTKIIVDNDANLDSLQFILQQSQNISPNSKLLMEICRKSEGLSGRALRKVPFIAHALFLKNSKTTDLKSFIEAMEKAVRREHNERAFFKE